MTASPIVEATSAIQHIVLLPEDVAQGSSFFQRFAPKLLQHYQPILNALSIFPHDVFDALLSKNEYVLAKMRGSPLNIGLLRIDLFETFFAALDNRITVLWSSEETNRRTSEVAAKFSLKPLHISTFPANNAIHLDALTTELVNENIALLVANISASSKDYRSLGEVFEAEPCIIRDAGNLPFQPLMHNCTAPLVRVLESYGFAVDKSKPISPGPDHTVHIDEMLKLTEKIDEIRGGATEHTSDEKNDAIVYCPSVCTYLYDTSSHEWNKIYRELDRDRRNFLKTLIKNKGFSNSSIKLTKELFDPYRDAVLGSLLIQRQYELKAFTEFISIVAVNQFAPPLRLPNSVMLHHAQIRNIYNLIKSTDKKAPAELASKVSAYTNDLKADIGEDLLVAIFSKRKKILAACDFPIEWIPHNGIPVMFSHEISRIPSTPGDLFGQIAMAGERVLVPLSDLSKVLVIRSFADSDPIRNHTQEAIEIFSKNNGLEALTISIVDTETTSEVEDALNKFSGAIVIFDCHGDHGGDRSHGWLQIGKSHLDVWELANRARIPPIVILSACSTHAIDGSHASVANGLIRSGAKSVLGTFAPVNSVQASTVVGRLLYRIAAFLPIVLQRGFLSWRTIVSGFLRMSYSTDLIRGFEIRGLISKAQYREIHMAANTNINNFSEDWHEKLLGDLLRESGMTAPSFESLISSEFQFVETMIWAQLGRPENLLIYIPKDSSSTVKD